MALVVSHNYFGRDWQFVMMISTGLIVSGDDFRWLYWFLIMTADGLGSFS